MACTATIIAIPFDCQTNLAGVDRFWLAAYGDIKFGKVSERVDAPDAQKTVGGIIIEAENVKVGEKAAKLIEFVPAKNTASITKTMTKNDSTGVKYWNNEIVAQFNHMDADKREALDNLDGSEVAGIVKDKNGIYWAIGYEQSATVTAATGQTGAAADDGNFYSVTITDVTGSRMRTIKAEVAEALIAGTATIPAA